MGERGEGMGMGMIPGHTAAHQISISSEPPARRSRRDPFHLHPVAAGAQPDPEPSAAAAAPNIDDAEQYSRSRLRPESAAPLVPAVRYKECMRNHAASSGRHVVDGCGEFIPVGDDGTNAMRCAACDCHRSFHRQEIDGYQAPLLGPMLLPHAPHYHGGSSSSRPTLGPPLRLPPPTPQATQSHHHHHAPPEPVAMMSFGEASSSEGAAAAEVLQQSGTTCSYSRKRSRTRFTEEQKERMAEFAERIGWRIQKQDEPEVHQFCSQIGVKRKVFKVWMHNNKQPVMKQQQQQQRNQV